MKLTACKTFIKLKMKTRSGLLTVELMNYIFYLYMTQGPSYMFETFMICFVSLYIYDLLCVVVYIFTDYINNTKNVA